MSELNTKVYEKEPFNADNVIKDIVQDCVGSSELQKRKQKLQNVSSQVSLKLKQKVFENYSQFISTAREISLLESEMYQLNHILVEQRTLLTNLREESLLEDPKNVIGDQVMDESLDNSNEQDQNKKAIAIIKDALIGYSGNFDSKVFIHEGGLIELDSNDYRPICRTHLFLFNDTLIISKIKHDKKLQYMSDYETKKIAVINIKDKEVRNAINIITNDGPKIFQCISSAAKMEWIEKFEMAIKFNQTNTTTSIKSKKGPAPQPPKLQKQKSSFETQSISSDMTLSPTSESIVTENMAPDWLYSASEEIQAEIAQRHFEDSLELIQKCEEYLSKNNNFYNCAEVQEKIKGLKTLLSTVLLHELSNSQCRNLQSVLRSSRRFLRLLVEMGKGREACNILLRVCTTAIRTSQRQARRNNLVVSELFFCDLAQVATEFLRAFNKQIGCTSALVVWSNTELQYFASQLIKHYLTKGTPLETVAKVVESVREPCEKLREIGLDLMYYMEGLMRGSLEQLLLESRHRLLDSISRTEEIYQPYNLQTKTNLRTLLKELSLLGLDLNGSQYVTGDTFLTLTQTTVNFCRNFMKVTESCAIIGKNDVLKPEAENLLKDMFMAQYNIKPDAALNIDLNFVSKQKSYLSDILLPIAISKFEKVTGTKCFTLSDLQTQLKPQAPKPKPRNVYKTEDL